MKNKILITIFTLWFGLPTAYAFETKATHAILMDANTGAILYQKDAETAMPPSSMSKLMTVYMVFDSLTKGNLSLEDKFMVSERAWRMQGSKMFIHINDQVSIHDLLLGVIVQSGNDACITLAEGLMGSEEAFANAMNEKAKEIGLKNSYFVNSTGWPNDNHYMTALDLATLSKRLINDFPQYYHYFSIKDFTYNNIRQENRNMLLSRNIGVDGLKTGHTDGAGYGIAVSAEQKGRRLIMVVNGLKGTVERAQESEKLLLYGFLNFANITVAKAGEVLDKVRVWRGEKKFIDIAPSQDIIVTLPKTEIAKYKMTLNYATPQIAPIKAGQNIATLTVTAPSITPQIFNIHAKENNHAVSAFKRVIENITYYLFGLKD